MPHRDVKPKKVCEVRLPARPVTSSAFAKLPSTEPLAGPGALEAANQQWRGGASRPAAVDDCNWNPKSTEETAALGGSRGGDRVVRRWRPRVHAEQAPSEPVFLSSSTPAVADLQNRVFKHNGRASSTDDRAPLMLAEVFEKKSRRSGQPEKPSVLRLWTSSQTRNRRAPAATDQPDKSMASTSMSEKPQHENLSGKTEPQPPGMSKQRDSLPGESPTDPPPPSPLSVVPLAAFDEMALKPTSPARFGSEGLRAGKNQAHSDIADDILCAWDSLANARSTTVELKVFTDLNVSMGADEDQENALFCSGKYGDPDAGFDEQYFDSIMECTSVRGVDCDNDQSRPIFRKLPHMQLSGTSDVAIRPPPGLELEGVYPAFLPPASFFATPP